MDDEEIDHQRFIEAYKDIIGAKIEDDKLVDDDDQDIGIKHMVYREILHCFENYLNYSYHKHLDEEQQLLHDLCLKREEELTIYINSIPMEEMTEELKEARDMLIVYFVSYGGNQFLDPKKLYYPKCKTLNHEYLNENVLQLSKHMLERGMKTLNDYASLGWMTNLLPKTSDTYEDVIRFYYFGVCTCRDIDESQKDLVTSNYYDDFWTEDLKILTRGTVSSKRNRRMQRAYIELAKLVFLPFLYGYDWTIPFKIPIHEKIRNDLILVSECKIPTPSDIGQIVKAIIKFSGNFTTPDPSDSPYLRNKVDEYIKLSDAKIRPLINKRNQVIETFTSFQKKEKMVQSDRDLNLYLTVFMNTVTSSYRIAEMMNSGKFETEKKEHGIGVHSFKHFLDLVPVIGLKLHQIADKVDKLVKKSVEMAIEERVECTVNSFYNKELEMLSEYV